MPGMKTYFVDSFTSEKFKGTGTMRTELLQDKVCILGEAVTVLEGQFIL